MAAAATWLIILGVCLLVLGLILRVVLMMRSSDATPAGARVLHGRQLIHQYASFFPSSRLPLLMRASLLAGLLSLGAGIVCEIFR